MKNNTYRFSFGITISVLVILFLVYNSHNTKMFNQQLKQASEECQNIALRAETDLKKYVITGDSNYYKSIINAVDEFRIAYQKHPNHIDGFVNSIFMAHERLANQEYCLERCNLKLLIEAFSLLSNDPLNIDGLLLIEVFANPDAYPNAYN